MLKPDVAAENAAVAVIQATRTKRHPKVTQGMAAHPVTAIRAVVNQGMGRAMLGHVAGLTRSREVGRKITAGVDSI